MAAYCCVYYVDNVGRLKEGLAYYRFGKVSFQDAGCIDRPGWMESFSLSYRGLAEDVKYSVLSGIVEPVVVPGLFLKSSNGTYC